MKKIFLSYIFIFFLIGFTSIKAEIKVLTEGNPDAKITMIIYESLTCSHCADFHKNVYPKLKENFLKNGLAKIEFRSFPLNMAALNASKIAHCPNNGDPQILHFLYKKQSDWLRANNIVELNENLRNVLADNNFKLDFEKCINDKKIEDYILEDRINGVKKFDINATPTLIINEKKFDKPLTYKNLKKTLEKLI